MVVALAGTLALVLFYSRTSRWEHRGFVFVVGLGVYLGVESARMFERVTKRGRLPAARLER